MTHHESLVLILTVIISEHHDLDQSRNVVLPACDMLVI